MKMSEFYWHHITLLHFILWPLSLLFDLFMRIRNFCYRLNIFPSIKLPVPIIVVDSVTTGDNGKTPLSIWLVEMLQARGLRPGIIALGNIENPNRPEGVTKLSDPTIVGGKAMLFANHFAGTCPVWVGSNPALTAQALLKAHPDCNLVICTYGLLNLGLQRDFEIAVVDFSEPSFGNGLILPAGPLHANLQFLKNVDAVVVNNTQNNRIDTSDWAPIYQIKLVSETVYNLSEPGTYHPIHILKNKKLHALTSYENSPWLAEQLQRNGLRSDIDSFNEDHRYEEHDFSNLGAEAVIMPEEEALQCLEFAKGVIWALPAETWINSELQSHLILKLIRKFAEPEVMNKLICPYCERTLRFQEKENLLICDQDHFAFPIRDGIPFLQENHRSATECTSAN